MAADQKVIDLAIAKDAAGHIPDVVRERRAIASHREAVDVAIYLLWAKSHDFPEERIKDLLNRIGKGDLGRINRRKATGRLRSRGKASRLAGAEISAAVLKSSFYNFGLTWTRRIDLDTSGRITSPQHRYRPLPRSPRTSATLSPLGHHDHAVHRCMAWSWYAFFRTPLRNGCAV